jgi:hypothetical protein
LCRHFGLALARSLRFFSISAGAADDLLAEARIVAQTERAFSVRCAEIGFRDSFLEYFAAGGDVSGNLGFTYGTASDAKSSTAYLRVWLWRQSTWWLLFDVATIRK